MLVILCDGFQVEAALVVRRGRGQEVSARVRIPWNHDPQQLLPQLEQLVPGKTVRVIVAAPEVLFLPVELPVDPQAPLSQAEMRQLLTWELGDQVAQAAQAPLVAEALVGQGVLEPGELWAQLAFAPASSPTQLQGAVEQMVGQGRLSAQAVADAQKWCASHPGAPAPGTEVVCSWQPSPQAAVSSEAQPGQAPLHTWLVAAVAGEVYQRWASAFESKRWRWLGMVPVEWPLWLAAQQPGDATPGELLIWLPHSRRRLSLLGSGPRPLEPPLAHPLLHPQGNPEPRHPLLWDGLGEYLGKGSFSRLSTQQVVLATARLADEEVAGWEPLCLREPVPPWWRRPVVALGVSALVWAGVLLALETHLRPRLHRALARQAELGTAVERLQETQQAQEARRLRAQRARQKLAQTQQKLHRCQRALELFQQWLPQRRQKMLDTLDHLAQVVSSQVVLRHLELDASGQIRLEGWATDSTAAQEFLARWIRSLGNAPVRIVQERMETTGGLGTVEFELRVQVAQVAEVPSAIAHADQRALGTTARKPQSRMPSLRLSTQVSLRP